MGAKRRNSSSSSSLSAGAAAVVVVSLVSSTAAREKFVVFWRRARMLSIAIGEVEREEEGESRSLRRIRLAFGMENIVLCGWLAVLIIMAWYCRYATIIWLVLSKTEVDLLAFCGVRPTLPFEAWKLPYGEHSMGSI